MTDTNDKNKNHRARERKTRLGEQGDSGDAAWRRVTAQTRPLSSAQRNQYNDLPAAASRNSQKKAENAADRAISQTARPDVKMPVREGIKPPPRPILEPKTRRRLSRGRTDIDAVLDMHGMSLVQAQAALTGFVAHHRMRGHKFVLVITGKGVRGEGRLKAALPDWLAAPPLATQIIEYEAASLAHGGSGAFYLRLRK